MAFSFSNADPQESQVGDDFRPIRDTESVSAPIGFQFARAVSIYVLDHIFGISPYSGE
jgi:hypothetical protein